MCRMIEIALDDLRGHLVEPPVVDTLTALGEDGPFSVLLVPDPRTAAAEKVTVTIDAATPEGRRIAVRLKELAARLCAGDRLTRLTHAGGGDFVFHFAGEHHVSLSDARLSSADTLWAYTRTQDIAVAAEIAYRLAHSTAA